MYSYTSYHPAGHEPTKKAAALPTPAESNPLGAQVFGDGKSVPPFVLRFRKQLDDDPEQSQEPAVGETATMRTGNGQNQERFLQVMNDSDQTPAFAIESAGLDPYAAARAYPWRTTGSSPGPGHNDELKHTAYRPSNLGRAPHHASDSFHETSQRPGGLYYRVPQPGPFRQDTRRPLQEYSTVNNDAYAQSNLAASGYDVSTGAHMATALSVQNVPRQMPIKEFELLEKVKDHYSEQGLMLHERVTGTLLQHHKDLSERLEQLSLADDAFLQRASKLDASLCRPFAETRTYDPDVEGSSATLGDEIEKVQREAVELEKALDNMEKECQTLQASENEVFNRLLQNLRNPDPEGKLDAERRRIKKQGQKLEQQVLAELDEIQREFEKGKAQLDREISKKFWG